VVDADDVDLLAEIAAAKSLVRPNDTRRAQLAKLLDRFLVLSYRNGEPWYDLHPMLRRTRMVEEAIRARAEATGQS
jgi:hypothetical protein